MQECNLEGQSTETVNMTVNKGRGMISFTHACLFPLTSLFLHCLCGHYLGTQISFNYMLYNGCLHSI